MMKRLAIIALIISTLSPVFCRAESVSITHDFQTLAGQSKITINSPTNTIATTAEVTYTCSGGANFYSDANSFNKIAVFLDASGEQVTTTQIANLDSMLIYYYPTAEKGINVSYSTDSISWKAATVVRYANGVKTIKFPAVNDYYVRISRKSSDNVYVWQIKYYYIDLSDCPNCFIYKHP